MQLGTFSPRERSDGDSLPAKEATDRTLVVLVREHRTGIVTKFKPEGGEGVVVDVADVSTNEAWISVLWMNGAVVDNLTPYVGQPVAVKLVWQPSAKGGNPYITVKPLEGAELAAAQQWAAANTNRFDLERQQRAAAAASTTAPQVPGAPAQPPSWVPQPATQTAPAAPAQVPAATPPATAAPVAQAAAPATGGTGALDANSPEVQALLAQINGGQNLPPA